MGWVSAICVWSATVSTVECQDRVGRIRIHDEGAVIDVTHVAAGSAPASIAVSEAEPRSYIVSGGSSVVGKGLPHMSFPGSGCVMCVSGDTGNVECSVYHQVRPDYVVSSSNGKYVALASRAGWAVDKADKRLPGISKSIERQTGLSLDETNMRLRELTVGTLRYSIWEVQPFRPIWEMRFYGKDPKEGEASQFVRPWAEFAKVALPWWAIAEAPIKYRDCRIAFSPDSQWFVAHDLSNGIHAIRLVDGKQIHCCRKMINRAALGFTFAESSSVIRVIYSDRTISQVDLVSGEESKCSIEFPSSIEVMPLEPDYTINFAIANGCGLVGVIQKDQLTLLPIVDTTTKQGLEAEVRGIGLRLNACRLETSEDGRFLGIGYGTGGLAVGTRDTGSLIRYEVADRRTGKVIRRIVNKHPNVGNDGQIAVPEEFRNIETIVTNSWFAASLKKNGKVVYAVAVDGE
jgi:hypothetical protein